MKGTHKLAHIDKALWQDEGTCLLLPESNVAQRGLGKESYSLL